MSLLFSYFMPPLMNYQFPLISVIIPVFNAEEFLEEAISSVFNQNYHNWELILVDDGSTDSSPSLCRSAAHRSPRVRTVYLKNNKGLPAARNAALEIATGQYITFLDADDLLHPRALSSMAQCAAFSDADIVCADILKFKDSPSSEKIIPLRYDNLKSSLPISMYDATYALGRMLYQKEINNSVCGKLFHKSLWKDIRFCEGTGYEDLDIIYHIFLKARKIARVRASLYLYRQHPSSYIHTFTPSRADVLSVTRKLTLFMDNNHPALAPAARSRELSANFNILSLMAANREAISSWTAEERKAADVVSRYCWNKIKELRLEALRNSSVRLKNKIGIIISYLSGRAGVELIARVLSLR